MNILFCSAGRRVELLKDFRKSMDDGDRIVAADLSELAPALYVADAHYLVPRIDDPSYLDTILSICRKEKIDAVTTLIDPEIALLAQNRERFEQIGVEVLAPYAETAELCFDKFKMSLIIQRLMIGDLDADVYIDTISHRAVSAFSKRKLETKIGGASKTVSFKDEALVAFIQQITQLLKFNGPVDMDFFFQDGVYYLSEINPRFGGAYLHAYGAGVDFVKLIKNNLNGVQNTPVFGNYEENVVMMMYDSVVITKLDKVE